MWFSAATAMWMASMVALAGTHRAEQLLREFVHGAAQRKNRDVFKERQPAFGNIGITVCCFIDNRLRDKESESCSSLPPRSR